MLCPRSRWSDISKDIINRDAPGHHRLDSSLASWFSLCSSLPLRPNIIARVSLLWRCGTGLLGLPLPSRDRRGSDWHAHYFLFNCHGSDGGFMLAQNLDSVGSAQHGTLCNPHNANAISLLAYHTQFYSCTKINTSLNSTKQYLMLASCTFL